MRASAPSHLASHLGDLVALAGVALLALDGVAAVRVGEPTRAVVADLALMAAGLVAHRVAVGKQREAPALALALLVLGTGPAVVLVERWWLAIAAGTAVAVLAPHFVRGRRALLWIGAGALLSLAGVLAGVEVGGAATLFALATGFVSRALSRRLRGAAAHVTLELEQAIELERQRSSELLARLERYESLDVRRRGSLLRVALTRRLGAMAAVAGSIGRDLRHASAAGAASLEAAAARSAARAEQLARLAAGGAGCEHETTLALVWPRVVDLLGDRVLPVHHIEHAIPANLRPVAGTAAEWAQILAALVENAIEAMPNGGVVKVTAEESPRPGFARVVVEDNGRGIPPEILPHVMEPFYTSRAEAGADGLGLAMVASVVEALEGDVDVVSTPGAGTRVEIDVPFYALAPPSEPAAPMRLEGTLLVADDDREMRQALARLLSSFGLEVVEADSGTVALAHLVARPDRFRAVVLDVVMPGTPIDEVVARAREMRPKLPVLLVSGYDTGRLMDGVLALGGVRFLKKPLLREELFASLRDLFTIESA